MIAMITAISRPGIRRLIRRATTTTTMTPIDSATSAQCTCGSARMVSTSLGRVSPPAAVTPSMSGSCETATWMPTPVRNPTSTVRDKKLARKLSRASRAASSIAGGQQGRQPGQPDVPLRAHRRETGERGGEYDRGRGIRGHHQVAGRTEDGVHRHRQEHRVQAGDQGHPGDLGVAEHRGDAEGGEGEAGQRLGGYPGSLDGQYPLQHGPRPRRSTPAAHWGIRHRFSPLPVPGVVRYLFIISPPGVHLLKDLRLRGLLALVTAGALRHAGTMTSPMAAPGAVPARKPSTRPRTPRSGIGRDRNLRH